MPASDNSHSMIPEQTHFSKYLVNDQGLSALHASAAINVTGLSMARRQSKEEPEAMDRTLPPP